MTLDELIAQWKDGRLSRDEFIRETITATVPIARPQYPETDGPPIPAEPNAVNLSVANMTGRIDDDTYEAIVRPESASA